MEGVDRGPAAPLPPARLLAEASTHPDTDPRNQDRFARDTSGTVRTDASGAPVPADPAISWFGKRRGLGSQAHAYFGLTLEPHADDPEVLETDP